MEEGNVSVLVDAKEEYTKQLISILKQCIYQGVKSIYLDAKDICNQDNTPEKVLMVFQDLLSRIPKWSQDIINKEYDRIINVSKCDYIEDLVKVIYVSHIKVLTIVHRAQKNKKITLKVPNGGHFIHLCYIECAREFWKDPYLFSENVNKYELQKNMRDSEIMIAECIIETIRKQLPVRNILKEFLNEPDEDIDEMDEDIKEPINKKYMKKLESVVKKELKTSNKDNEIDIDLIRKVIREELNSRPDTGNSTSIKKELVDLVVEKIVEQTKDAENAIEVADSIAVEAITTSGIITDAVSVETFQDTKSSANASASASNKDDKQDLGNPARKSDDKQDLGNPARKSDDKQDLGNPARKSDDKQDLTTVNIIDSTTLTNDKDSNNKIIKVEKHKKTSTNNKASTDNKISIDSKGVIIEDIYIEGNMQETAKETAKEAGEEACDDEDNVSVGIENLINDEDVIELKTVDCKQTTTEVQPLVINNIDEINLNLDELDYNFETDLDLEEVNISKDEVKTEKDTKYLFFKDE